MQSKGRLEVSAKFFSDTNLDGFLQSIAQLGVEFESNSLTGEVQVEYHEALEALVSNWGGVLL